LAKFNIFEEASVYPIIINGQLNLSKKFTKYSVDNVNDFIKNGKLSVEKILKKFSTLKDANFKIQGGLAGFQANSIKNFLSNKKLENSIDFTVSGGVDRYFYDNKKIRYMGDKYETAYIDKNCNLSKDKLDFWLKPKIVIAGMTKVIESVYTNKSLGLGVGIYGIQVVSEFEGYVLTAILNSKFINNYFSEKFKDKSLAGGYLAINKNTIEEIPYIKPKKEIASKFFNFSKEIHRLKKDNPAADTSALEREIDVMVYALYGLNEDEINTIEAS
ncbi:MAG: TaqI-like C-terminal specificity domain-containing protein, partial [Flavobacterium sp.]